MDLDVQRHHGALGQQASGGHEEAGGDAGHTEEGDRQSVELHSVTNLSARLCLLPSQTFTAASRQSWDKGFGKENLNSKRWKNLILGEPLIQPFLQEYHGDHEGHRLLNIVWDSLQFLEGVCCRINDVEELAIPLQYPREAQGIVCHDVRLAVYSSLILLLLTSGEC